MNADFKFYRARMAALTAKFGLSALALEGVSPREETTVKQASDNRARQDAADMQLSFGSTSFRGERVPIYWEMTRPRI